MQHPNDDRRDRGHLEEWLAEHPDAADITGTAARLRAAAGGAGGSAADEALVASYLAPGPRDRHAVRRLLDDPALRRDVAAAAQLAYPLERLEHPTRRGDRRPKYWAAAALLVTAASLAGIVTLPRTTATPPHRAMPIAGAEIRVVPPSGEGSAPKIAWALVLSADRYELEVTAADGRPVFRAQTADTLLRIPDGVLEPGVSYFFRVRARLEVGRWITSDFQEFVVRP